MKYEHKGIEQDQDQVQVNKTNHMGKCSWTWHQLLGTDNRVYFFFGIKHAVSQTLAQTNPRSHRVDPKGVKVLPKWPAPYKKRDWTPDLS